MSLPASAQHAHASPARQHWWQLLLPVVLLLALLQVALPDASAAADWLPQPQALAGPAGDSALLSSHEQLRAVQRESARLLSDDPDWTVAPLSLAALPLFAALVLVLQYTLHVSSRPSPARCPAAPRAPPSRSSRQRCS